MELKRKELQQECVKLSKEHEKKFGVSCDFQLEIDVNSKVGNISCPYCDLELRVTKMWEAKIRQVIKQNTPKGKEPMQTIKFFCTKELKSYLCER